MEDSCEDGPSRRPLSYRVALVVVGMIPVGLSILCVSVVHPPIGDFRTVATSGTTTLHLSAGDRYAVYGDNWAGDVCSLAPRSGARLTRAAGYARIVGGPGGVVRYHLTVTRTGTYRLRCNLGTFGDAPDDLALGPDPARVTVLLLPFFPGIPLIAIVAWRLVRAHRRRAIASSATHGGRATRTHTAQ